MTRQLSKWTLMLLLSSLLSALLPQSRLCAQDLSDTTRRVQLDLELFDSEDEEMPVEAQSPKKEKKTKKEIKQEAQNLSFSNEYLDTVVVKKKVIINDYSMIGVQYGAGLSRCYFNPSRKDQFRFSPINFGVMYTRYGKMFGYMPFFGIQIGAFYETEGYKFKPDKETGTTYTIEGANEVCFHTIDASALAHCHIDFWKMKLIVNLGYYLGYRLDIERFGDRVPEEKRNTFLDYDRRFDYGVKGGVGFGLVLDPVEIHIQATYKHSFQSVMDPDAYSKYFFTKIYPMNIVISAGLHFQLTRRAGKTSHDLRKEARNEVYQTSQLGQYEYKGSQNWE